MDEFETLVRNEWRRRLGRKAYRRDHFRAFIRALIAYALAPERPIRGGQVDDLLWRQVSMLQAWGMNRHRIQVELARLTEAIWDVVSAVGVELDRSRTLTERIEAKLRDTLGWPE